MKYYRIAIVAPMEYRNDDPVWACFETLRLAGHAVEVIDPRRFANCLNEDGSPDMSTLSTFVDRFKPDYIGCGNETAEQILEQLEATGKGSDAPIRRFVVFGYVGPNNFGDELIFSLICRQIEKRFAGAHIQLIGHDPNATLKRHGIVSTTCDRKIDADVMLRGASALVYMAGIMFDDAFEAWSAGPVDPFLNPRSELGGQTTYTLMATLYDVPAVFLGIGAGPLANADAQRLVRLEARCGARYLPRDAETERLLLAAGVPAAQIDRKADLAFTLEDRPIVTAAKEALRERGLEPSGYIAISLREHRTAPENFVDTMAQAIAQICRSHELKALFIDLSPEDVALHRAIIDRIGDSTICAAIDCFADGDLTVDLISAARAVIAMRLHCSIVANVRGVQSIGFDYNEKIAAYYELMDRSSFLMPMDAAADRIAETYDRMDAEREGDLELIARGATRCHALAMSAFDELERIVDECPMPVLEKRMLYPRDVSFEEQWWHAAERERDEARAERDALRAEADALRAEIDRLRGSTAWRVGRAITAAPRALKRALDSKRG